MNLKQIYDLLESHLENGIEHEQDKPMRRIRLPIPEEFGGGVATGNTMEDAVRNLISRLGITAKQNIPTFAEAVDSWMAIKEGQTRSPSTISNYHRIINVHMKPFFESKRINEITPDDIQLYFNSIMKLSKSYSSQSRSILKGVFERADRMGLIKKNPMQYTYERSKKIGEKIVLQDEDLFSVISDLDKLRSSEDARDYLYACFLCFTALRRGEILGLRWKDIDFNNMEITVRNNVTFPDGVNDPYIEPPKDDSYGVVHLNSQLNERLRPFKGNPEDYILGYSEQKKNNPMTRSMFTKMFRRIKKSIDLKGATSHSFRSTYATMMNAHCEHIDPKALQGALRHKTPDLAIKVYTKSNQNKTRQAEKEYDEYLCRTLSS